MESEAFPLDRQWTDFELDRDQIDQLKWVVENWREGDHLRLEQWSDGPRWALLRGRKLTPREEFESQFGQISDDQWQWLKEFVERNRNHDPFHNIAGYQVGERIYHPNFVNVVFEIDGQFRSRGEVKLILRDDSQASERVAFTREQIIYFLSGSGWTVGSDEDWELLLRSYGEFRGGGMERSQTRGDSGD